MNEVAYESIARRPASRRLLWAAIGLASGLSAAIAGAASAEPPQLGLPLQCDLGETCFIQQYVDADPGPGALDYTCGGATYDGHKGTDFRVRSVADVRRGVPVVAAAAGIVKGLRDGMPDRLLQSSSDRASVKGRECGNGLVIDHGDGWETQYCHLRNGSIQVSRGARISRGQSIGLVGYSGDAAFPHVHISVRHNGNVVDPFTGRVPADGCNRQSAAGIWDDSLADSLAYKPGQVLEFGFASGPVDLEVLVAGSQPVFTPSANLPAIVIYAWSINLLKGDRLRLVLSGPAGVLVRRDLPALERNKAQYMQFIGKKRPAAGWPAGTYTAHYEVIRKAGTVLRQARSFVID